MMLHIHNGPLDPHVSKAALRLWSVALELQGPVLVVEPPARLEFSNSSGARLECAAHGSPPPRLSWLLADGSAAPPVAGLRLPHDNGSLEFPPFPADRYRHDVHSARYRCRAANALGTVLSRDVLVRAVVKQKYEVQVYDEYVISGNTAVLRCQVPSYVAEYVMVTSWLQDGAVNIYPNTDTGGKYAVLESGDLYIFNAGPSDGYKSYSCRSVHRLTGEVRASAYPGRIIITEPKGSVQPRITVEKHVNKQVKVGDDVILPCVAQGFPVPTYRWFREDNDQLQPMAVGDRVSVLAAGLMRISKIRLEDQGKYLCWVNNSAGEETVQVTLTVTAPLSAHVQPQSQVVDVGKEASFMCIPGGYPITRVSWYRNGKPIVPDSRFEITSSPEKLSVKPLQKEDHGMYQCFVSNEWEMAQATAELQLGDASPELLYWFAEQTLQPGPAVSLKCVATGNPPPQFIWTLDGFPVPDSPRFLVGQYVTVHDDVISHVNISNLKEEDGGEYTCTAKNSVAQVSHSARINVYGLPFIRIMPKITAVAGSDLVIKCPVAGYPIESIVWERDGNILPMNRRQRVYPNGTLVIEHAQRQADAGTYTCQAQNRQKHTARRDVEVQVLVPPKILPIQAMTNLLREGMRAAISCQILEGDLPITFRWERNGQPVTNSDDGISTRRLDEYSTSLVIERITSKHTGNYTCVAHNVAGSESFTVPLTVNVPPHWTVEPTDANVASGQDVTLHCQADGYPVPSITWRKAVGSHPGEYKEFLYEPNVNFYRNGSLEFLHISKDSEGYYLCEAKNEVGTGVSKVIFLKVNAPAYFPQKSKQMQVEKGEQAHLQCTALGDTPIDIMWKVGGKRIADDMDQRYTIREQKLDDGMVSELGISRTYRHDTGVFSCYASNSYGQDEMAIQLIVQEVPEMPKNIRINDQQSRSLQLSWTQPYAGNSPITSYTIQYKLVSETWQTQPLKITVPGTQTSATVQNLNPASSYHFRIMAENRLGMSDPSEVIQVTTQEEVPTGVPQDVRAEARSSTELFVTWEPPLREHWNGNLLGYYVGYQEQPSFIPSSPSPSPTSHNYSLKTVEVGTQYGGEATLQGLSKFTTYTIIVQAYNSRGAGPASDPITVKTLEDVPSLPPENVQCSALTSQSLEVSWETPPVEGRNGIIQGYKVSHQPAEEWYESNEHDTEVVTDSFKTALQSLQKYTNYSISVLAFTNSGDGVKSPPVYCRTEEDVPSAPADIKAVVSSSNKILVSWLPPQRRNGKLTGYTFYMGIIEDGKEEGTHKRILNPQNEVHETDKLKEGATYQFWVTASTAVGEGESTRVVTITPSNKVPARIVSFSRTIITPWKQDINLPCRKVGAPTPQFTWRVYDKVLEPNGRKQVNKNGSLVIKDIQRTDEGNYTCSVENQHGKDEIVYSVHVRVPPDPPSLSVIASYADSLQLQWTDNHNGGSPILGYVINYKRDHGDWEELHIESRANSHLLQNLWCGTRYQLYITAYNKIGTGLPCDIVNAYTKGTVPVKPKQSQLLTVNSTVVTIWLDSWGDGGCAILYFIIEYHDTERSRDWTLVSNNVLPTERVYSVLDLTPATKYRLRVTAHNNAGSTIAYYNFTTLTVEGATVIPEIAPPVLHTREVPFYANVSVIVPIVVSLIFLLGLVGVAAFIRKKKLQNDSAQMGESPSVAQMQNQQNRDQQYLAVRVGSGQQALSIDSGSYKTDSADYIEDICPYATFQLAKPPYSESTYSGNVYSGPYHSVRGSFVYHDPKLSGAESYKFRHQKEPEYTKVRRKGGKLRDPHSESQESDNLGSTDSEVKKILTLHLPISEYDTLGSDSEGELPGGQVAASQELVSFRHRMAREVGKSGMEESSSSSETSPSGARKPFPSRKSKSKGQVLGKRQVRSSSGYSSHTEETTFSFSDRIHPPSRFSDSHSHELSEAECDMSKLGRKSGRSGASTRLSRETSFQIDV
ncbi:Down syndrome cell adhesion molecule-like protein Dscam2 [Schistocerca nitens]|uniref:Down syndrome cell adhesion molecule-like protein Dscam2 n=1 Tax=Schistocerca nitens TaxID=7011 RepID=UPI002117E10C|nr:Down syndrome cell adhesion molecule-like protein Dscam2 [Schistocerca nitens]